MLLHTTPTMLAFGHTESVCLRVAEGKPHDVNHKISSIPRSPQHDMHGRRDLIIIYERGTTDRGQEWRMAAVGWWIGSSAGSDMAEALHCTHDTQLILL